jgi:RNA polymerase sigma-70 factor (sigma-E family)
VWELLMDGDPSFTVFVRAYTSALLRTAYLLTGTAAGAEDLVQDTLVRLYPKWESVEDADVSIAYVRRSLVNAFLNQTRRPASRDLVFDVLPERAEGRDVVTQLDDRDQIWTLLRTLPERQRAAVVLRFFHDLPDEQIGAALGCRVGTVRSLISRGLAALRGRASEADSGPAARRYA